jgi:choline kinase
MRGVILTGRGDRLKPITGDRPTRLTTVGGCTIFERQRGFPWIEIDSPNDYWRACTHIALVAGRRGSGCRSRGAKGG